MRYFFLLFLLCVQTSFLIPAEDHLTDEQRAFLQQEESIPSQPSTPSVGTLLVKTTLTLAGLSILLMGLLYILKRTQAGKLGGLSQEGNIRLLERKYLSPKTSLWLVEINSTPFVILDSPHATAIHPITTKPSVESI